MIAGVNAAVVPPVNRGGYPAADGLRTAWLSEIGPPATSDYLVRGLIERSSFVGLIGAPGSGKTNLALALALHVATGEDFFGRLVRPGPAVYLALEGDRAVHARLWAYRRRDPSLVDRAPHFAVLAGTVNLGDRQSLAGLLATLDDVAGDCSRPIELVVLDTLARSFAFEDENSSAQMGRLVAACDRIRERTGACLLAIHHAGKDTTRGARGSSALTGALDTELFVDGADVRTVTATKQRNLEPGQPFVFRLEPVTISLDPEDSAPITATVVVPVDREASAPQAPVGKWARGLLTALQEWAADHDDADFIPDTEVQAIWRAHTWDRRRKGAAIRDLTGAGFLAPATGGFRLVL